MHLKSFLDYLSYEKKYARHTITAYKNDIETCHAFLTKNYDVSIDQSHYKDIRQWIIELVNQGISNRSINRKISSLNTYFKFLIKTQTITVDPLLKHKPLKVEKKVQVPFSISEVQSVLKTFNEATDFESSRNLLMIELFYGTGIRRSELISLKKADINIPEKRIKVLGKRNKERYLPLLDSTILKLEKYSKYRVKVDINNIEYLFLTKKGTQIYESLVYRTVNNYFKQVSLKIKCSPHVLRHSFATHLLNEGAQLNAVKELLGHSSLAATEIYTHSSLTKLKNVYKNSHPRQKNSKPNYK